MKKLIALLTFIFSVASAFAENPVSRSQATFYLSPGGNDANDGKTPQTALATLAKARDTIRPFCASMTGDLVVEIDQGDYFLSEPVVFTEQDSGTNGFNVIYRNQKGIGSARFLGGSKLSGWTLYKDNIYQARLDTGLEFTTLYENGIRADLARWPKRTSPFATSRAGYMTFVDKKGEDLSFLDSAISPDGTAFDADGKDFKNAWVYAWQGVDGHRWCSATTGVTSASNQKISIKPCRLGGAPDSFLIEGSLGLLSRPGEFFYDSKNGLLYYYSRFPGTMEEQQIIAPKLVRLIDVAGSSSGSPVHNIQFTGLTFAGTDRIAQSSENDWGDKEQAGWDAALYVKNARDILISKCHITDSGINGVTFDEETFGSVITGCLIEHCGYHGVNIKGGAKNTVSNCLVRYCGELRGHGRGVNVLSESNTLKNLEIYYIPRAGVAVNKHTDTSYVKVHDCVQDSGDQGGFYLVATIGNTFNQCTSFHNYTDLSNMDRPPTAIYDDRDATDTVWSNIDAGDSQFYNFRHDPMKQGTLTYENVSWDPKCNPRANEVHGPVNPVFDRSKMEYDKIGVAPDFPSEYNDLKAAPVAPLNLWAQAGYGGVILHWTQADRATGYNIKRSEKAGGPYLQVGSRAVPVTGSDLGTTYTDPQLIDGRKYYYVITSVSSAGESLASLETQSVPSPMGLRKLSGRLIGRGNGLEAVIDGDLKTFLDSPDSWAGLDLGSPSIISEIHYAPRSDNTDTTARMHGGEFQGATDAEFTHPVVLFRVLGTKGGAVTPVLIPAAVFNLTPVRYVRFIGPSGKPTTISEMEFYGHP